MESETQVSKNDDSCLSNLHIFFVTFQTLMGIDWKFHRYWINGKTRMYIMENTGRTPLLNVVNFYCFSVIMILGS